MWDTIHAISTPEGMSLLGILRVSGIEAFTIVQKLIPETSLEAWPTYTKGNVKLHLPSFHPFTALLWVMRKPHSYTREDVLEIHLPGAVPLLQACSSQLLRLGSRLANPGEFTQRAFLNGRLSLAQAEGILELIHSENRTQLQSALQHLAGRFTQEIQKLRHQITSLLAKIEANIDFSYHGEVEISTEEIPQSLCEISETLKKLLQQQSRLPQHSQGISVALIGHPNVGKSTLFNQLIAREEAIVSPQAGTTRDILKASFTWKGYTFLLHDSAGIEYHPQNTLTQKAQAFRQRTQENTTLHLFVFSPEEFPNPELLQNYAASSALKIAVLNKKDLPSFDPKQIPPQGVAIAAKTGEGLETLKDALVQCVQKDSSSQPGFLYLLNTRHQVALEKASLCLKRAEEISLDSLDFIAFELREASTHLATLTGEILTEDILDQIFSQFCIGK
jgi:tRNA modification GTPase